MSILGYVLTRLLAMIPVLIGVTLIAFLAMQLVPGDPIQLMLGGRATEEVLRAAHAEFGLDKPVLVQYGNFLWGAIQGDLGTSIIQRQPVTTIVGERIVKTLFLLIYGTVLAVVFAVPLSMIAAMRNNRPVDHAIRLGGMIGLAMPPFWIGLILMLLFGLTLGLFPIGGYGDDFAEHLWHLFLPALTIALFLTPILVQSLRASMLDVMTADYIEVARSKGLSPMRIMLKHVLRNALIPCHHDSLGQYRLAAERHRHRGVRVLDSRDGLASRALRRVPRFSGHPGARRRLHADRHDREPARRPQLHAGRPPRGAAMNAAVAMSRGVTGAVRAELRRWPMTMRFGVGIIGAIVFCGIFAPYVAPYDPYYQDYGAVLLPPSWAHPFGTDMVGRDIFSRVIYGIRIDMQVGFILTYVPMIYGVVLGAARRLLRRRCSTPS